MLRYLITSCVALSLLSGCVDYTPTPKSMVSTQEKVFHYSLSEETSELEPYAWEELESDIKTIPLSYVEGADIITNRHNFIHTKGYEQISLALWRSGLNTEQVRYVAFDDESAPVVKVAVYYKGISYPDRCPDWRHSAAVNHDNSVMSNYGCASAINLGHMVANKQHLLESIGKHNAETESSVNAVERYYKGDFVAEAAENSAAVRE